MRQEYDGKAKGMHWASMNKPPKIPRLSSRSAFLIVLLQFCPFDYVLHRVQTVLGRVSFILDIESEGTQIGKPPQDSNNLVNLDPGPLSILSYYK